MWQKLIWVFIILQLSTMVLQHSACHCPECRSTECCIPHLGSCLARHGHPGKCCGRMYCCKTRYRDISGLCKYAAEC